MPWKRIVPDENPIITFQDLDKLITKEGWPLELWLHPDDYIAAVVKFAHPGMRGHDEKGEYIMFLTTKLRPNPPIRRQTIVDLSGTKLGWE